MNFVETRIRPLVNNIISAGFTAYRNQRLEDFCDAGSYSARLENTAIQEGPIAFWRGALEMTRERKGHRDRLTLETMTAATLLGSALLSLKDMAIVARKPLVCLGLTYAAGKLLTYGYAGTGYKPKPPPEIPHSRFGTYNSRGTLGDNLDDPAGYYHESGIGGSNPSRNSFDPTIDTCPADTGARLSNAVANANFEQQSRRIRGR